VGGTLDRIAAAYGGVILLLGRLALAAIFVPSGYGKFTRLDPFAQSLAARGLPASGLLAIVAACVEFFGGVCVALGLKTRYAALAMAVFTAIAALIAHRFWQLGGAARTPQYIQFMKNLAIIGGFLYVFVAGPGSISLDRRGR
jgi:putative oxidoreductase